MTSIKKTYVLGILTTLLLFSCVKYKEPDGLIENVEADAMEELYKANQFQYINERLSANGSIQDDREFWFPISELENYVKYVKKTAKANNYENLGIRVYFGAKDTNEGPKSNVFFVGTHNPGASGNVQQGSFFIEEQSKSAINENRNMTEAKPLNMGSAGEPDGIEYNPE